MSASDMLDAALDHPDTRGAVPVNADPYALATLFHVLANTFGVCHSVSVEQPLPRVERVEAAALFILDDYR